MIYHFNLHKNYKILATLIQGIKTKLIYFFSNLSPAVPKLLIIQMVSTYIIFNFNYRTKYLHKDRFDYSDSYMIYSLFEKANTLEKFVGIYNLIFSFIFIFLSIFTMFYFLKATAYYSFRSFYQKNNKDPKVNIYLLIPLFIFLFSSLDYIINSAYFKMFLSIIYTSFLLILLSKMSEIASLYKKEFNSSIIQFLILSTGCRPMFCIPNLFKNNYYIFSLNLNFKSWHYIPIIIFMNKKGIYVKGIYFSIESIDSLNNNFNKKMVQYTKQEFEMLKIFNF